MITEFSEASRLIIQNWDLVKEIHKTEDELAITMREFLLALKHRLDNCRWWNDKWCLKQEGDAQVYIAHRAWKRADGFTIWIGVENFTAESLFGTDSIASLYVWVSGNRPQLAWISTDNRSPKP